MKAKKEKSWFILFPIGQKYKKEKVLKLKKKPCHYRKIVITVSGCGIKTMYF